MGFILPPSSTYEGKSEGAETDQKDINTPSPKKRVTNE
jgi:hypothetical protein